MRIDTVTLLLALAIPIASPAQFATVAETFAPSSEDGTADDFGLAGTIGELSAPSAASGAYTAESGFMSWDRYPPSASCEPFTVQLVAGAATIVAADLDGGSTDNVGIQSITAGKTSFTLADVGSNIVSLTVVDFAGHVSTCNSLVTVQAEDTAVGDWMTIEE